jgi:hypothetical protein
MLVNQQLYYIYEKRLQNLRVNLIKFAAKFKVLGGEFGLRASSLNLRVNLIKFEGKPNLI